MPTKTDYVLMGIGVLAAVLLVSYAPAIATPTAPSIIIRTTESNKLTIDNISGINTVALNECRKLGLM